MHETSKSMFRKLNDSRFATRYLRGNGIDIGAGHDSLNAYGEFFPLMKTCRTWDIDDGDAELMASISDDSFDFIHSSHCLEHMRNPLVALNNWLRILKPGGHLIAIVPDEDLYEQGVFPSAFNPDHRYSFTIYKQKSWNHRSINLVELLASVEYPIQVLKIELLDATFRYGWAFANQKKRIDQTATPIAECAIEFIVRKDR